MVSESDTSSQAAMKVLFCGGVAGVVTWASIFPLGKTTLERRHRRAAADEACEF